MWPKILDVAYLFSMVRDYTTRIYITRDHLPHDSIQRVDWPTESRDRVRSEGLWRHGVLIVFLIKMASGIWRCAESWGLRGALFHWANWHSFPSDTIHWTNVGLMTMLNQHCFNVSCLLGVLLAFICENWMSRSSLTYVTADVYVTTMVISGRQNYCVIIHFCTSLRHMRGYELNFKRLIYPCFINSLIIPLNTFFISMQNLNNAAK